MGDDLDRLNRFYDDICGKTLSSQTPTAEDQLRPPPPPSLEAIEGWMRRHRDRHALSSETYCRLDSALENIEEVRRGR